MPDYLPLCAFRQDLLPAACRSCAWWLTSGVSPSEQDAAYQRRQAWMASLESTWGSTGLIHTTDRASNGRSLPAVAASIHYAPVSGVPRLRDLPLGPIPPESVLLFCLRVEVANGRPPARRILQKALAQVRLRGASEVYAFASEAGGTRGGDHCEFFALDLLEDTGFKHVRNSGDLYLMRVDLRGLATLVDRFESAVKKIIGGDPAPSPAAWTRRG